MDRVKIGNKINNWINEKSKTCKIIKFLNTDEPNKYIKIQACLKY